MVNIMDVDRWCEVCGNVMPFCDCDKPEDQTINLSQAQKEFMALYLAALDFGANRLRDKAYENILWPAIRKATQSTLYNEDVIDYQTWSAKSEVE
jgi:hypothetical protein